MHKIFMQQRWIVVKISNFVDSEAFDEAFGEPANAIDFEGLHDMDDIPFDEEMDRISEEMEPQNLVDDEASNDISEDKK